MFKLPWANLSQIPIMTITISDSLDILRRAPRLESASFIYTEEFIELPLPPLQPLRHENLKELALLASPGNEVIETQDLFRNLIAPHLRSLRICNMECPISAHLYTFLASIGGLESLYLRKTALTEDEIIGVLELLPTLKHLTLLSSRMFTMVTDLLLTRLIWRSALKPPILPKLETLEISLFGPLTAALTELLESRWKVDEEASPVVRLLEVKVDANDDYDDAIVRRLETLVQAGMRILIETTDVFLEKGLEYFSSF
ncbi:hypothetical protein C0992_008449 [Termitomyces sp. T32_za158]|nr:hypothetical protein C0992_008449 [Termitomyces sp. T32_za158]